MDALVDSAAVDLERVIEALAPVQVVNGASVELRDLAYEAGAATPGSLFFCVPGLRADGHDFAPEAVRNGATALVVERRLDLSVPQLVVADARAAMGVAAAEFFGHPTRELLVAAVTGTNGKTTTAFVLHAILEAAGLQPGLIGTVESRIGDERRPASRTTPEAIDLQRAFRAMLGSGARSCAMEATSHGAELKRLAGIRFAVLVFTNLSQDHLDFHGTLERYFEAKRRLFVDGESPPAAVNVADAYGRRLADELRARGRSPLLTFGLSDDADVRPDQLELSTSGARFSVSGLALETRLVGRFNVENVLGAIAAARLLGIDPAAIAAGVAGAGGVPGRFEPVEEGQGFVVLVDYAHTPDSLRNVLLAAHDLTEGRVICVFGCGGDRDRSKRPAMGRVASELSDLAIVTSDNPRSEDPEQIARDILGGAVRDVEVALDRRAAIERALQAARAGDVVLIAGKGHERRQELRDRVVPFDDRQVARETLRRIGARA